MFNGLILGLCMIASSAFATPESPMTFRVFDPCRGTSSLCAPRILASGVIESDSHKKLAKFIASIPDGILPSQPTIVFDSPGGSITGGIALGRLIRKRGYDTALERNVEEEYLNGGPNDETSIRSIATDTICASACSLAFLGGHTRSMTPDARYGVHRFYSPTGDIGDSATQETMTALALYIETMGVDRRLLDLASLTAATDMRWLEDDLARDLRIDNTRPLLTQWRIDADSNGTPSLNVHQWVAPNRELTLSLQNDRSGIAVKVIAVIAKDVPNQDRRNLFPVGEPLRIEFRHDWKTVAKATPASVWRKLSSNADGSITYSGIVAITHDDLQKISRVPNLWFDDGFSNALSDLSFSTELSVKGLKNGANLLLRTR